jgi:MFS family permease
MAAEMRPEDRAIVAPLGFLHGVVHANLLAIPVFLVVWKSEYAADDVTLGLLAAVAYACFGLGSVPFGFLADRRASRTLLLVCGGGIAASLEGIALSPSLPVLATALAGLGLASGIYHPTGLAAISRIVREQGRGMGWHGMGGSLGIAFGPAVATLTLTMGWSWRLTVGLLGLLPLIAVALLLGRLVPESIRALPPAAPPKARTLLTKPYVRMVLVYLFAGFAYQGSLTFLPRFIGLAAFVVALGLGAIGQVLAGTLADRRRADRILFALSVGASALLVLLAVLGPSAAFTVGALAFGFFLFSLEALQNTLVTRTVPGGIRGFAFGLTFLSVFGLGSAGAAASGILVARGELSALFLTLAAFLTASGSVALGVGNVTAKG